ncbi:MAG: hypothetical protein AAGA01_18785 [Cyanobacteria bacterium P01_E01_bin.43]
MPKDRLCIPVDEQYVSALGLATYAFARCEWQVVWCCEKIKPGSVGKIVANEMTAGKIGQYFANLVRNMPKSSGRDDLAEAAEEFNRLVLERNRIIHGKPCTSSEGQQRLSSNGIIEISNLEEAADAFAACGGKLNSIFYGFLKQDVSS